MVPHRWGTAETRELTKPMQDEHTSMEVEGAKSASTLASSSDATAESGTMSTLGADVHRVTVGSHLGIASRNDAAANEAQAEVERAQVRAAEVSAAEVRAGEAGEVQGEEERPSEPPAKAGARSSAGAKGNEKKQTNNLRKLRIERMMSKAELARRANLSVLTIDRIEKGFGCRMDSKRKILEALGLSLADRVRVFGEEE